MSLSSVELSDEANGVKPVRFFLSGRQAWSFEFLMI